MAVSRLGFVIAAAALCHLPPPLLSQTSAAPVPATAAQPAPSPRYPVLPTALPEEEEIALARSAAPPEVSDRADVYVLRGTEFVKVRSGTNGCACLVSRDLHEGSLYPLCFDQEGTRTVMLEQMRMVALRASGLSEAEVRQQLAAERESGVLPKPTRPTVTYMMSPRQVIFSSPEASGRRVGAWHPHIMMAGVQLTPEQLGLPTDSRYIVVQSNREEGTLHEFVVLLPVWSDGTPAPTPRTR